LNGNESKDFAISIDFAKHISMMARTPKGHEYRNYFIELESQQKPLSHLEVLAQSAIALVEMDNRTKALESEVKLLSAKIEKSPTDYFTVAGFASVRGVKVDVRDANKLGRKAARLSKEHDYPIGKAHSEIFGEVNTYHLDILSEVFESL
jgi:anti-repressor protein